MYNNKTDWQCFREIIEHKLYIPISLKSTADLDSAVAYINNTVAVAATFSTPDLEVKVNTCKLTTKTKALIRNKRKLRKQWQSTRQHVDKIKYNQITRDLKEALRRENSERLDRYLENLGPTPTTIYSLWKATKNIQNSIQHKSPLRDEHTWARTEQEKANLLSIHFYNTFKSHINSTLCHLPPIIDIPTTNSSKVTVKEISGTIQKIQNIKAPGYDKITGKILKELPAQALKLLAHIINSSLNLKHFPTPWKVSEIIAVPKPGKDPCYVKSFRPISLLPTMSKMFETVILTRIEPILNSKRIIPAHQFGFRRKHSTIQQLHRVVHKIENDFDSKRFCVAAFLDIAKAFDSVWHDGLIHK